MTEAEIAEIVAGSIAREVVAMLEPMISRVVRRVVDAVEDLRRATPPLRAQAAEERPEPIDAAPIPAAIDARDLGSAGVDFVRAAPPRGVDLVVPPLPALREYSDGASAAQIEFDGPLSKLSRRERQIAQLFVDRVEAKVIASSLGISFGTVAWYKSQILRKTNARTVDNLRAMMRGDPTITDEEIDKHFAAAPAIIREVVESIPPARPGRIGTPSIHAPVQDYTPPKFVIPARTVAIAPSDRAMTAISRPLNAASLNPKYSADEMAKAKARIAARRAKEQTTAAEDARKIARRKQDTVVATTEQSPINPPGTLPTPHSTWIF